jgi:hypothetical protein
MQSVTDPVTSFGSMYGLVPSCLACISGLQALIHNHGSVQTEQICECEPEESKLFSLLRDDCLRQLPISSYAQQLLTGTTFFMYKDVTNVN